MKRLFRSWVASTVRDSGLARQQALLNLVLLGLAGPGFLFGLVMACLWMLGRAPAIGMVVGLGVQPFYLLAYWLGRRGRVRLASLVSAGVLFLVMFGVNYQIGLGHVVLIGYAMVTLVAGVLVGTAGALAFALLSMVAYLGVGALQVRGVLAHAMPPETTLLVDGIGLGLGLVVLVVLNWLSNWQISQSLRRETDLTAQLRAHQAELEGRIAERTAALTRTNEQLEREISERRDTEEALRESERQYRVTMDSLGSAIHVVDTDLRIMLVNQVFKQWNEELDLPTNLIDQPLFEAFPFLPEVVRDEYRQVFQVGETLVTEESSNIGNQEIITETRKIPISEGEQVTRVVTAVRDITERKRAAEQVRRLLDQQIAINRLSLALGESWELARIYRIIYDHVQELMDVDAFIVSFYERETQLLRAGYVISDDVERDATQFPPIPLEAEGHGTQSRVIRTGQPLYVPDYRQAMTGTWTEHTIVPDGSVVKGPPPPERKQESTQSALLVPMKAAGETIGVMQVQSHHMDAYSQEDTDLLSSLANVAALTIENARLFNASRQQAEQLEALRRVSQELTILRDSDSLLAQIVEQAIQLLGVDGGGMYLYRPERDALEWVVQVGGPPEKLGVILERGEGLSGKVLATGETIVVDDYHDWSDRASGWADFPAQATMSVPIQGGGEMLGVLNVWSEKMGHFGKNDVALLSQFAAQAAIAIHNARLYEDERISRERAEALRRAAQAMGASLELHASLRLILDQLKRVIVFDTASLLILQKGNVPDLVVGVGYADERMTSRESKHLLENSPILAQMCRDLQPVVSGDVRELEGWIWVPGAEHVRSWMGLPLVARDKMIGTLMVDNSVTDFFTAEDVQIAQALAQHAAQVIEKARLFEDLQRHAQDLEERVARRTRDLAAANERLKELDRLKSKFVSDVSHELRTPITNIKLYLHLLRHDDAENWPRHLSILEEESERLARLIEDILNLSRLDMVRDKMELAPVELNQIVRQVVAAHRPRAEAAGLDLKFEPDETLPPVWGQSSQLTQVATNLVTNAVNYTPAGHVRVRTASGDGKAFLEVEDTGMGIDPEDRPHLFERFYRGKRVGSSNIPGTGLGLAIVQEIVELHGGEIKVESQPDQGSRFRICLPLAEHLPQEESLMGECRE